MKRKSFFLWSLLAAALTVTSCSDSDVTGGEPGNGETGKFNFSVTLTGSGAARAAGDRPIPPTSWDNINNMLFVLYKDAAAPAERTIVYADLIENPASLSSKTFQYADVPTGEYILAVVANAGSGDNVLTTTDGTQMNWGQYNIRQKLVNALSISYLDGTVPSFMTTSLKAYQEPAEVFMAYSTGVEIKKGETTTLSNIQLKREVSLARLRIDYTAGEDGVDNTPASVDYGRNSSIIISVLPKDMGITYGSEGGSNNVSEKNNAIIIGNESANVFSDQLTVAGYTPTDKNILTDNYKLWREVVVFPNSLNRGTTATPAGADREYFVVISATGKVGHKLTDGTTLNAEKPIYWGARVRGAFLPNTVSELNFNLKTGGSTDIPEPQDEGILEIELGAPLPWDSNVQEEDIDV